MRGERRGREGGVEPVSSLLPRPCCCLPPICAYPPVHPAAAAAASASSKPGVSRAPPGWFGPAAGTTRYRKRRKPSQQQTGSAALLVGASLPVVGAFEWRCQLSSVDRWMKSIHLAEKSLNILIMKASDGDEMLYRGCLTSLFYFLGAMKLNAKQMCD